MYPDFIGIGAQKAGTSWLHHNLAKHPQIWMPPLKEIHYFDHEPPSLVTRMFSEKNHHRAARHYCLNELGHYFRGRGDARRLRWAARYWLGARNDAWYQSLFEKQSGQIAGEICPGYCRLSKAQVAEVYARMPNARILYFLRDPIGRAWSAAVMHFNKRGFPGIEKTSDEAICNFLAHPRTLRHADYLSNLDAWQAHYPPAQFFVGFLDEIESDPAAILRRVLSFLGVDDVAAASSADESAKRINAGQGGAIPERFRPFLARLLGAQLLGLQQRFDNVYTRAWLANAERSGQLSAGRLDGSCREAISNIARA